MSVMIGIEVHCQLNTASKLFCNSSSDHRGKMPNECTCPICLGFPGSKPVVNKRAIELGMMIALALKCKIAEKMFFSRKTYFYPDMSKNYQITQYEAPLAERGLFTLGENKIRIRRVHIEEDPARLIHVGGDITSAKYVLIDYNRSGIPLAEIVTEPDFTAPKEVRAFLEKMVNVLEHLGAYDSGKEATLRVDANISTDGGERVEVKNITGFENVEKALNYEIIRQSSMKRSGNVVVRETRHFDADTNTTKSLRKKEYEEDYGYIFDPDLPSVTISRAWLESVASSMPELPDQRIERFVRQYSIDEYTAMVIVYSDKRLADFFEECCARYNKPPTVSNWIVNYLLKSLNWRSERISQSKARPETFVELLQLIDEGKITDRFAKELIKEYVDTGISPRTLAQKEIVALSEKDLDEIIVKVLQANANAVEEYRNGKKESLQFLIGKVLSETRKQGNPKKIKDLIVKLMPR
ncbi:MAG: Asp-tRNA(Asn)/Glu-tRNA(Gln) amidotransferase subunit GatB [Candidatus Micrarchaeales archaeon]|nr:Asp-tRNA(Asn)/Glu-tRNA(Gln) amidotransferase subunit GatB [Candidatus Micrarchaeales archaeon]